MMLTRTRNVLPHKCRLARHLHVLHQKRNVAQVEAGSEYAAGGAEHDDANVGVPSYGSKTLPELGKEFVRHGIQALGSVQLDMAHARRTHADGECLEMK